VPDLGPITKIHYTLRLPQLRRGARIVTVDDDTVYSRNALANLLSHGDLPVACHRSMVLRHGRLEYLYQTASPRVDVAEGYAMAAYDADLLRDRLSEIDKLMERLPESRFTDDLVISAVLPEKYLVPSPGVSVTHDARGGRELCRENVREGRNERVLRQLLDAGYFRCI
jgi:hypothetical protein